MSFVVVLLCVDVACAQTEGAHEQKPSPTATAPPEKGDSPPHRAQQPEASQPKNSSQLEQMLTEALANNPDIRVAEAKLRGAQAELNRVRLQVLQKVSTLRHAVEMQKAVIEAIRRSPGSGEGIRTLAIEEAKLASLEAEIPAVLGRLPHGTAEKVVRFYPVEDLVIPIPNSVNRQVVASPAGNVEITQGAMADRIRKALDRPVHFDIIDKPFSEALKMIEEKAPGVVFHTVLPSEQMAKMKVNLHLEDVPLGAALLALEDSFPEMGSQDLGRGRLRLAVREYGILVTKEAWLPPGAMPLHAFWKGHATTEKPSLSTRDNRAETSRPPENVEGRIKAIDPQSGLVTLNVGSDAGLRTGDTLEVYRIKPEPKYLGSILVVEVRPTEAVARPTGRPRAIEVGDRVTSNIRRR